MVNRDIVYLTGTPASGKTTIGSLLSEEYEDVFYVQYGLELIRYLRGKRRNIGSKDELRQKSSKIVTQYDIEETDTIIANQISQNGLSKTVILDSHAVTKEEYGYRIVPFNINRIRDINFSKIFVLFTQDEIIKNRIENDQQGRILVNNFEVAMHRELQCSLAITYGVILGIPIYYFDTSLTLDKLKNLIADILELKRKH